MWAAFRSAGPAVRRPQYAFWTKSQDTRAHGARSSRRSSGLLARQDHRPSGCASGQFKTSAKLQDFVKASDALASSTSCASPRHDHLPPEGRGGAEAYVPSLALAPSNGRDRRPFGGAPPRRDRHRHLPAYPNSPFGLRPQGDLHAQDHGYGCAPRPAGARAGPRRRPHPCGAGTLRSLFTPSAVGSENVHTAPTPAPCARVTMTRDAGSGGGRCLSCRVQRHRSRTRAASARPPRRALGRPSEARRRRFVAEERS